MILKLDRLGRSVKNLIEFVNDLERKKVHFKSLTEQIDTASPMGRFFFHVMASLAQMERELIVERTRAGLKAAKQRGRIGGKKRQMTPSKIESAKNLLEVVSLPKKLPIISVSQSQPSIGGFPLQKVFK